MTVTMPEPLLAFTFGVGEVLLIVGVLMLVFGAKKLPLLARGVGESIRNFKGEIKAPDDEDDDR